MPRGHKPCGPGCEHCELLAERHADRINEARAEDMADELADRYERELDQRGPLT